MDRHKDSAQVQRLEVVELGRRRRWTAEAKLRIVEESLAGHRQVSATARRYGISTSLLFSWRKAHRAGHLMAVPPVGFVPVTVAKEAVPPVSAASARMEIVTRNGYRVILDGVVDETALVRVLAVLARS